MNAAVGSNMRETVADQILGAAVAAKDYGVKTAYSVSSSVSNSVSSSFNEGNGNYALQTLFYLVLFGFLIFLILIFVHFTVTPVFQFVAGGTGLIQVPGGASDGVVYWNDRKQPVVSAKVPKDLDTFGNYLFDKDFSFSVDLFVRRLTETTASKRLILYKHSQVIPGAGPGAEGTDPDLITFMSNAGASMVIYLTDTNDIVVTFICNNSGRPVRYNCPPIKNIPLYIPFRLSVVVENRAFTVYLNGKQTFQRIVPQTITLNTPSSTQYFYSSPAWANLPAKTVFLQNFHVWPRVILQSEVLHAQPALAREEDFDLPAEPGSSSCT